MNKLSNINYKKHGINKKCKAPEYKPNAAENIRLHLTDSEITEIFILAQSTQMLCKKYI